MNPAEPVPKTRWAFPVVLQRPTPAQPNGRREALLLLLAGDLRRGHSYVAIRHFLMMQALGLSAPEAIESQCIELLEKCPSSRRKRISRSVEAWLAMLDGRAIAH
jgi:hypothetical protein